MARPLPSNSVFGKLAALNWLLPLLLLLLGTIGVLTIYSASGGTWHLGAAKHLIRLLVGLVFMIIIALTDIRVWFSMAYPVFILAVLLLIGVAFFGVTINGSQRWLDLGPVRIQPSELMKLATVMALARFYHDLPAWRVSKPVGIFGAAVIVFLPAALILHEPDLGTALMVVATGIVMIFLAGISWRIILMALGLAAVMVPAFFMFGLKDYQRERILTFLDPSRDPTGASYHIIQSKIALGSGGVSGKGFMQGTQSALKYVPENRTDFIFT
ncbi:MAG TPA: rod shape-determining protein RodA, partial [Hellea balneolensis]|nr:rod shape-determining protein RodA [Hellea balneolensis]